MKTNFKIASMVVATLLALNSNANAGAPGSGGYLAIGAILAGAAVVGATGVVLGRNADDIKEFELNKCTDEVANQGIGWKTCCTKYNNQFPGCTNDTNPPTGTGTNPNPPRCDLNPNLPICNNPDPARCDLFPNKPACTPPNGGGNGVSEPMGILAGLTALGLFFVARRRK